MKRAPSILIMVAIMAVCSGIARCQYWYGVNGPIPLRIDSSKITIRFSDGISGDDQASILRSIHRITSVPSDSNTIDGFIVCSLSTGTGYMAFLDSLSAISGIEFAEPYYLSLTGQPMLVGAKFCAAFNGSVSDAVIDSINAAYKIDIDHEVLGLSNTFILNNTDSSGLRLLELANTYHNLPQIEYAHPDFRAYIEMNGWYKPYDYYNEYQPHLKKVIGQFNSGPTVWDFAGINKPVVVAVLDDGIEPHEDLPQERLVIGYDVSLDPHGNNPVPGTDCGHGMGCAGIIAASHTLDSAQGSLPSTGIISMDPYAKIMPVKIFNNKCNDSGISWDDVAQAIGWSWMHGATILSNSWNAPNPFIDSIPEFERALEKAFAKGRNGRGCPIIFSAGNFGDYFPGTIAYPARLDMNFAVGACDLRDSLLYYSCFGGALDIVAPSGDICLQGDVWTLDRMDMLGFNWLKGGTCGMPVHWYCPDPYDNNEDYNCNFGGTSAACPLVSGTAALLISRDSTLTAQQIYDILRYSAIGAPQPPMMMMSADSVIRPWGRLDAFRALLAICRGDANNNAFIDAGDAVYIVNYVFKGGPPPQPHIGTGDANCDGEVNLGDAVYVINYIFKGGPKQLICYKYNY